MDANGRSLDLAGAAQQAAVVIDLHQTAGGDLGPVKAKRDPEITVTGAGYGKSERIDDSLAEPLPIREAMRGREIDPLPPRYRVRRASFRRGRYQSHYRSLAKECGRGQRD